MKKWQPRITSGSAGGGWQIERIPEGGWFFTQIGGRNVIRHQLPTGSYCGNPKLDPQSDPYHRYHDAKGVLWHHNAGGPSAIATMDWFATPSMGKWGNAYYRRVATHFAISRNGQIVQGFGLEYWASHIGEPSLQSRYSWPSEQEIEFIGIEVSCWGPVKILPDGSQFIETYKHVLNTPTEVITYPEPFRGASTYERYSQESMDSLRDLTLALVELFGIETSEFARVWQEGRFWDLTQEAVDLKQGIAGHINLISYKSDPHPDPRFIDMVDQVLAQLQPFCNDDH